MKFPTNAVAAYWQDRSTNLGLVSPRRRRERNSFMLGTMFGTILCFFALGFSALVAWWMT